MRRGEPLEAKLSKKGYHDTILETIGWTPLVRLRRVVSGVRATVLGKLEMFNPGGSVKDRIGVRIIEDAEKRGLLEPGGLIVESTSGNTGAGLAMAAAVKGYKAVFTMPDKMSQEKVNFLKAFGAKVVVTPTAVPPDSPESYYEVAKRIARENPGSLLANQYFNPVNPEAHYVSTGPEIWEQTEGRITAFVAGIGTGGTISGVGRFLKEKNPEIRIAGVDPAGSILKRYFDTGEMTEGHTYLVEGIGEDIIPGTLHLDFIDEIISVGDAESFHMARRLAREEGILAGGSCGTAVVAALEVARRLGDDDRVVVLLPDTGTRYLSKFHSDEWMRDKQLMTKESTTLGDLLGFKSAQIPDLVTVSTTDTIRTALDLVRRHSISQVPVLDAEGGSRGTILEGPLLTALLEGRARLEDPVTQLMEGSLPSMEVSESLDSVLRKLAGQSAILATRDGRAVGIATRMDIIEYAAT
jgi:cystathionine beta-synthase